jgi:integrase
MDDDARQAEALTGSDATSGSLILATGLFGNLVLPPGTYDPARAEAIRQLAAQAAVYATHARGEGTLRAYRSAWRQYSAWCDCLGFPALSADPQLIGMYLTAAAERLAVATLQVHLAAIVAAHRLVGLSLDPGHPAIAVLLDGIKRRKGTRPARQAAPITPDLLLRMVRAQSDTPLGLRNRALLLTGFGGALRRSEIVALNTGDVEFVGGKGVVLTIRSSKTDPYGAGDAVTIWASDDTDLCAPTALLRWLQMRQPTGPEAPLFVGLRAGGVLTGKRLSDKAVVRLVKDTAEAIGAADEALLSGMFGHLAVGVRPTFSGHSLRAGLATAAAEAEAQLHDVMRQTRHKSVEVARRYMRSADIWRNNVTARVMRATE